MAHRAVVVPPGSHTVEMWYSNNVINRAYLLSRLVLVAALMALVGSALGAFWERRR